MTIDENAIREALSDRFSIRRELGRGGMAIVYLAHDTRYDRDVAIKVLRPELVDSSNAARFLREIHVEGRLQHPNILPIFESGTAGRLLYYVLPYVEGETLSARLQRAGPLDVDEAVRIAHEVADALASAHAQGVIHRDVKPGNILLGNGHAVLSDFGVAWAVAESAGDRLTSSGIVVGTPTYVSPEQADARARIDERSDIYSLGCVLYEMLAGEPPFSGRTAAAIFARHLTQPVPPLDIVRPGLPSELLAIVAKALAKVPADRFHDMRSFAAALDACRAAMSGERVGRLAGADGRRRYVLPALGVVALLALLWGVISFMAPASNELDPNRVVVFPLASRAGEDPDGEGVDLLIGMALDHMEPLRWLPGWNWVPPEQRQRAGSLTTRQYRAITRRLNAQYYMTGQILKRPDSVSIMLLLHDVRGDSTIRQSSFSGALGVSTYSEIALHALGALLPALVDPGRDIDLSLITDRSPAAIAHFVQGERQYRLSRFADALTFYRRALEADPLMAVAALKGAQAANWSHRPDAATELIEHALIVRSTLPLRYQSLLEGLHAYLNGEAHTALEWLTTALGADDHGSEAVALMGEVHHHLLPRGVSADSAMAHFERAMREDPGFTPPLIHLAEQAIREGRLRDEQDLRRRLEGVGAEGDNLDVLATMALCVRRGPDATGFVSLAREDPQHVYQAAMLLAPGARQSPCATAAFEALLTTDAWTSPYSWAAAQGLQGLFVAQGRFAEAASLLTSIVQSGEHGDNPLLASAGDAALARAVLNEAAGAPMAGLAERFEALIRQRAGPEYEQVTGVYTPWLLGTWHAGKGDYDVVERMRDHLLGIASDTANPRRALAAHRAEALSARLLLQAGDTADAIALLERVGGSARREAVQADPATSLAPERLLLATLYLDRGRYRAALNAAAAFDHEGPFAFLPFVPASLLIRHQAALGLGDARLAEQYTRRLRALGRTDLIGPAR